MLTYVLKENSDPLYEQLYRALKRDILRGRLASGQKLPSKRTFAGNLGVSTITVQNAYEQLMSEGYVIAKPRQGFYVADLVITQALQPDKKRMQPIALQETTPFSGIDLSDARMDPSHFPFSVWAKLLREALSHRKEALMTASQTGGVRELREAIAEHLASFCAMPVDPDQIIVGAGTEYLYGLLVQLLGKEKIYCVENPGYRKPVLIYRRFGCTCRFAAMDAQGISMRDVRRTRADVVQLSPNHHFPTGRTMPAERRYEMLAWAAEKPGRLIVEDDYDSEFRPSGKPLPTLFSMASHGKVIYMNTFSKSLTPTIRISYMVLPPDLAQQFYEELSFYACTVSNFEQYTLAAFIRRGYFEKHINRMRLFYRRRRQQILEAFAASSLSQHSEILENESGLHFLLQVHTSLSDRALQEKLHKKGVRMVPVSSYDLTSKQRDSHLFLIQYANLLPKKASEAFHILDEAAL